MALATTNLPVFVSSIDPSELAKAVKLGDVAVEIGNYDALYKLGKVMDASQILEITKQTKELINDENVFMSVTVPGHISVEEQISLAKELEKLGVDLIQTEGACVANVQNDNTRGLIEMATVSIANTIELSRNIEIPWEERHWKAHDCIMNILENQIIPTYYHNKLEWARLMRQAIRTSEAYFNSDRMVIEYYNRIYKPIAHGEASKEMTHEIGQVQSPNQDAWNYSNIK